MRSGERIYGTPFALLHLLISHASLPRSLAATIMFRMHNSNFGGVGWRVLRRASVHIRVGPPKITTANAVPVVTRLAPMAIISVPSSLAPVLTAYISAISCSRNLPSMLGRRITSEHWVESLAQLIGTERVWVGSWVTCASLVSMYSIGGSMTCRHSMVTQTLLLVNLDLRPLILTFAVLDPALRSVVWVGSSAGVIRVLRILSARAGWSLIWSACRPVCGVRSRLRRRIVDEFWGWDSRFMGLIDLCRAQVGRISNYPAIQDTKRSSNLADLLT